MRLILLSFVLSFFTQFSFAQITLEHDYGSGYINYSRLTDNENVFYRFNRSNSSVEIFNENHELFSTILIDTVTGPVTVSYVTRYLFDKDDGIEMLISYHFDHPSKSAAIIEQDGSESFSLFNSQILYFIPTPEQARMIVMGPSGTKVYRLAGEIPIVTSGKDGDKGEKGEKGDIPAHEWNGTTLRFENPDGSWGEFVDLQGETGEEGAQGAIPEHMWRGTQLRFQQSDGTWGEYQELIGPAGPEGPQGAVGECDCEDENGKVTGTSARIIKDAILQNPQPNPAKLFTHIFYNLPPSISNASLGVYNSEGKIIKTFPINGISGSVEVSTSGFSAGIYFYRLIMEQGVSETKKLIISR